MTSLDVTYQDSDGTGGNGDVTVQLIAMDRSTGSLISYASLDSVNYSDTSVAHHSVTFTAPGAAYSNYGWYARVDLYRASSAYTAKLLNIALTH